MELGMLVGNLISFIFIAIIIFAIAAIIEGKTTMKKGLVIRSVYFYLASLVTLGIVVGSVIFLFNLGLKAWVFTEAEPLNYRLGAPSSLYLGAKTTSEASEQDILTCEDDSCELSASQASNIDNWKENYTQWQTNKDNPNSGLARDAVNAFSFLIVALPLFIIHYRIVQRDNKKGEGGGKSVVRPSYFYFVSLASLIMMVIAGGVLVNLTLKTWVFPSAGEADKATRYAEPIEMRLVEESSVQSIVDCGESCGLDAETVALADQWLVDYGEWQEASTTAYDNVHRQAASTIPYIIIGLPLFWYHWRTVRRESKEKKQEVNNN
jgi:large-conductance mechanosensitive channel